MEIKEYGSDGHPTVVILQKEDPEQCPWFTKIEEISKKYHLIFPRLKRRTSQKELEAYLNTRFHGMVYAVCIFPDMWDHMENMILRKKISFQKMIFENVGNAPGELVSSILQ